MKRNRTASASALMLTVVLIAGLTVLAKEYVPPRSLTGGLLARLIPTSYAAAGRSPRLHATGERLTLRGKDGRASHFSVGGDAGGVQTVYVAGTGVGELAGGARAHALASADFDGDGVPDLVSGYAGASGAGVVTLQRGNADAVYPNSPEARGRRASGEFTGAPFHAEAGAYSVPEAAHFVGAGDFDADGHWDAVAARRGGSNLYFLRGDGHGSFAAAERVELPGELTALATGEMNRRDGLTDIVVGVSSEAGAGVLVFESPAGAMRGQPETLSLPASATGLALGELDGDPSLDLAVTAGNELIVVRGRDRRLSVDEVNRAAMPGAAMSHIAFESALAAVAVGDFAGDERPDVAVLSTDGALLMLTRAGGRERTEAEWIKGAAARAEQRGSRTGGASLWERSGMSSVPVVGNALEGAQTADLLLPVRVSGLAKDDLLVLGGGRAHVVANEAAQVQAGGSAGGGKAGGFEVEGFEAAADLRVSASVGTGGELAAVLPMRLSPSALSSLVVLGAASKAPSVASPAAAVTFTVNSAANTNDANPGDGECKDAGGNCTLPAATQELNRGANPGPFTINFNIPGAAVPVINTNQSAMYELNKPVVIDGTTQPAGRVEVVSGGNPFKVRAGNSTLRGLVISGSVHSEAIYIYGAGNNIIEGNYFGTDAAGSALAATKSHTHIYIETPNNRIGGTTAAARNVISGADTYGIYIAAGTGNLIQGNYIGTNAAGTAALGNGWGILTTAPGFTVGGTAPGAGNLISGNGVLRGQALEFKVISAGVYGLVQGNLFGTDASGEAHIGNTGDGLYVVSRGGVTTVGGTTPAARNVISGSTGRGVYVESSSNDNPAYVQGNYVGTNADGTAALPNLKNGISVDRDGVVVGGAVPGAGNLISGNGEDGINIDGSFGSPNHTVQGNLIGTDVSGTIALPNRGDGIETFRAEGTLVGGTTPEARNVISGNLENGIRLGSVSEIRNPNGRVRVQGNYIGVNRFGTGALGNGQSGILFNGAGSDIGGVAPGAGNVIAHNGDGGIVSSRDLFIGAVLSNSIHSNAGLGVDKSDDGVSPTRNDTETNPPVLASVSNTGAGTVITGTTQNVGNLTPFVIQFFSNMACDPSGHGEGQTLVGEMTVPAPTRQTTVNFSHTVSPAAPGGAFITAVAVRRPYAHNQDFGDRSNDSYSSEFSNCVQLSGPTPTPTPTPTPAAPQLFAIAPNRGGDAGSVTTQLTGQGFQSGATVKLTRAGQPDIVGTNSAVSNNGTTLHATFDLRGKARGAWSVVVTNPGGATAALTDAFTVNAAGAGARVWADIAGRFIVRAGFESQFFIVYGNTGDADAPATLLRLSIPKRTFSIARLPESPAGAPAHFSDSGDKYTLELLVSGVPTGMVNYIPFRLRANTEVGGHEPFTMVVTALTSPGLQPIADRPTDPNASATVQVTEETATSVRMTLRVTTATGHTEVPLHITRVPATGPREPSMTVTENNGILTFRYETVVSRPSPEATSTGAGKQAGDVRPSDEPTGADVLTVTGQARGSVGVDGLVSAIFGTSGAIPGTENTVRAREVQMDVIDYLAREGAITAPQERSLRLQSSSLSITDSWLNHSPLFGPTSTTISQLREQRATLSGRFAFTLWGIYQLERAEREGLEGFEEFGGITKLARAGDENLSEHELLSRLIKRTYDAEEYRNPKPGETRFSGDPNDKAGPLGAGDAHFITGAEPMSYLIQFENKPEASAPAQEVIVTDQLDSARFDFSTFQLGPVTFGEHLITPPPGLSEWTTDVDLRPANDLIVRINARLDKPTGVLTWRFQSIDPATGQPNEDALAGFLPPNRKSPEGQGSLLFTVAPKPGLQTGDEIRNGARIVFDVNAPIDTPVWSNTIDKSPPSSQVTALAPTQTSTPFQVQWSGADTGAGVSHYDIYVSENDGPFHLWLDDTPATSALYRGQVSRTYRFYSVAADGAGNLEAAPASADASTVTPNISVQFSVAALTVNEGESANGARLVVTRAGDASAAAEVSYRTVDDPAAVPCDPTVTQPNGQPYPRGAAYARCDYATTVGTLQFAPGETEKTIVVPLVDDGHDEVAETFRVQLSSPSAGVGLGAPTTLTVTIQDNDAAATPNPVNASAFFVRQHYLDFLSREPEAGEPWTNVLNNCADAFNNDPASPSVACDRLLVSSAFFRSPEFELKGFYVFRLYRVAFDRLPAYDEIIPDMSFVAGGTPEEVYARRAQLAARFAQRAEFTNAHGAATNAQYVSALLGRYSLTQLTTRDPRQPDTGPKVTLTQAQLTAQLDAGTLTRGQVLRAVADSDEVGAAEFNRAFVAMQYYGYLRRTPEPGGYEAWLAHLNANPSDFRTMVNGFVNSREYRLRFGQP